MDSAVTLSSYLSAMCWPFKSQREQLYFPCVTALSASRIASGGSERGTLSFAQSELPPSLTPLSLGEPKIIYYCQRAQRHLRMFSRERFRNVLCSYRGEGALAVGRNRMLGALISAPSVTVITDCDCSRRITAARVGIQRRSACELDCMRVQKPITPRRQFSRTEIVRRSNNAGSSNLINVAAFYFGRVGKLRHQ
jgi:hypothetical protein